MYFVVNKMSYFSVSVPGPLLSFACTHSYYAYKMTKDNQNMLEVQKHLVSFAVSVPQIVPCSK